MMQRWTFEPGIEFSGTMLEAIVEAFKLFPSVAYKRLLNHGIGTMKGKDVVIDRQSWYPIESWLAAFDGFAESVGPRALFQIGQNVPKHAAIPPGINDITGAIAAVDVGYHMNHRKNGKLMFDPATGQITPGIGTYGFKPVPGERKIISVCENPYPCEFDRGILTCFALRFERLARVLHDERAACRRTGSKSCTYIVTW
jgi:hypothetical protein